MEKIKDFTPGNFIASRDDNVRLGPRRICQICNIQRSNEIYLVLSNDSETNEVKKVWIKKMEMMPIILSDETLKQFGFIYDEATKTFTLKSLHVAKLINLPPDTKAFFPDQDPEKVGGRYYNSNQELTVTKGQYFVFEEGVYQGEIPNAAWVFGDKVVFVATIHMIQNYSKQKYNRDFIAGIAEKIIGEVLTKKQ